MHIYMNAYVNRKTETYIYNHARGNPVPLPSTRHPHDMLPSNALVGAMLILIHACIQLTYTALHIHPCKCTTLPPEVSMNGCENMKFGFSFDVVFG